MKFDLEILNIAEPCQKGAYRDGSMTRCENCHSGLEPNKEKDGCGKKEPNVSMDLRIRPINQICFKKREVGLQTISSREFHE